MAKTFGRCTNFGACSIADRKLTQRIASRAELACPECQVALTEVTPRSRSLWLRPWAGWAALAAVAGAVVAYFAFANPARPDVTPIRGYNTVMRFQGSNTIGAELVPALVRAFLQQKNLLNVTIEPRVRNLIRVTATDPGATKPVAVEIYQGGSNSAFPDLAKGSVDIGMSSRKVTAMEAASLTAQGDMNSRDCEHVLALDGIAVVVNPANPVNSLTIPSLRAIFSGQNTAWSELSRFSQPIHVYARVEDSGTTDSFERLVMGNELTHVVQQREGRVSAPASGSLPINDDPALENEADASARRIRGFIIVRCRGGRAGRSSDEVRRRETTRTGSGRGRSRPEEEEKK